TPLTDDERAAVTRAIGLAHQEELCQTPMRLKVAHASLADIAARLQAQLPQHALIEVRHSSAARFSFNLQDATLRQVLQSVADLSDCNFYLLSDRLLLAREDQLTAAEHTEYTQGPARLHSSSPFTVFRLESQKALRNIIYTKLQVTLEPLGANVVDTVDRLPGPPPVSFGQLSPELQQAVQQWFNLLTNGHNQAPQRLTPDATLSIGSDQHWNTLRIRPSLSASGRGGVYLDSAEQRH
ncbi:MAG: hypothetical protein JOZ57_13550, partial [Abitibacteriaceae bacterium]|nr:hypothetical protein [Abditibacteriaceae bacterium]